MLIVDVWNFLLQILMMTVIDLLKGPELISGLPSKVMMILMGCLVHLEGHNEDTQERMFQRLIKLRMINLRYFELRISFLSFLKKKDILAVTG